jgi:hypothetical protein
MRSGSAFGGWRKAWLSLPPRLMLSFVFGCHSCRHQPEQAAVHTTPCNERACTMGQSQLAGDVVTCGPVGFHAPAGVSHHYVLVVTSFV